jgi:hypothetical protein
MVLTEDLLVGEEETAVVSGTLEVVVGRTVTATATHSGPRVLAQITTLRRGRREGEKERCMSYSLFHTMVLHSLAPAYAI